MARAAEFRSVSDTPELDCHLLIGHVLQTSRSYLFAHQEETLPAPIIEQIESLFQRRLNGEPVAYLTGYKEFWSLQLKVTTDVLIPRPETELLVELALKLNANTHCRAADLGTGSGAIAIAIKKERPDWSLLATDISSSALSLARENALLHGTDISFLQGDWFNEFGDHLFDLLLCNPPYIAEGDPLDLASGKYEPSSALISDEQGFADLRKVISRAPHHLEPGGMLIVEHGHAQAKRVCAMLYRCGFSTISTHQDLSGHDRVTTGKL